jgi:hypothetical protein
MNLLPGTRGAAAFWSIRDGGNSQESFVKKSRKLYLKPTLANSASKELRYQSPARIGVFTESSWTAFNHDMWQPGIRFLVVHPQEVIAAMDVALWLRPSITQQSQWLQSLLILGQTTCTLSGHPARFR